MSSCDGQSQVVIVKHLLVSTHDNGLVALPLAIPLKHYPCAHCFSGSIFNYPFMQWLSLPINSASGLDRFDCILSMIMEITPERALRPLRSKNIIT